MKKKLFTQKGFTLVEVLVATAILAIFVSMAIVGTSAIFGTGEKMMTVSKAAVLGSDVMKAVTNEVRFGENFSLNPSDTAVINYNSTAYGDKCKMQIDGGGQLTVVNSSNGDSATKTYYPIGSAAYDEVRIKSISFSLDKSKKDEKGNIIGQVVVTCSLSITADGESILWEKSVDVVPLYQKTTA